MPRRGDRAPIESRYWAKVDKRGPDECWPWTAALNGSGYGVFWNGEYYPNGRPVMAIASRWTYRHFVGPIGLDESGKPLLVCHRCDDRTCQNPAHLFLGTTDDNMADMVAKGRSLAGDRNPAKDPSTRAFGDDHWTRRMPERLASRKGTDNAAAKLDDATVREIRARHVAENLTHKQLGEIYGVHREYIGLIVRRKRWAHID